MKNVFKKNVFIVFCIVGLFFSCSEEEDKVIVPAVDENGLTNDILNLMPEEFLTQIKDLGMTVNGGNTPPSIEFEFIISPYKLLASNRQNDHIGLVFADMVISFYNQNNQDLTIQSNYENGDEDGLGLGGFIVGSDNKFTAFIENNVIVDMDSAKLAYIYSGKINNNMIEDAYTAIFMIDNYGNKSGYFIENGVCRVFKDDDSVSPITGNISGRNKSEIKKYNILTTGGASGSMKN